MPRKTELSVQYKGKALEVVTLSGLAIRCGKSTIALKKLEEQGIIPQPLLRLPGFKIRKGDREGEKVLGERIYPMFLADKIVPLLCSIRKGVKITHEIKVQIFQAFTEAQQQLEKY